VCVFLTRLPPRDKTNPDSSLSLRWPPLPDEAVADKRAERAKLAQEKEAAQQAADDAAKALREKERQAAAEARKARMNRLEAKTTTPERPAGRKTPRGTQEDTNPPKEVKAAATESTPTKVTVLSNPKLN
jgi:hypothetical protein